MGLDLIRRNNQEEVTAYHDSVLFHNIKGVNGVLDAVGDVFALTYDPVNKVISIGSGMGLTYGRQFEVSDGSTVVIDASALSGTIYLLIYAETDLRVPTAETTLFKYVYARTTYPALPNGEGDNLIAVKHGCARMELWRVKLIDYELIEQSARFTTLQANWIDNSKFATSAGVLGLYSGTNNEVVLGNGFYTSNGILKVNYRGAISSGQMKTIEFYDGKGALTKIKSSNIESAAGTVTGTFNAGVLSSPTIDTINGRLDSLGFSEAVLSTAYADTVVRKLGKWGYIFLTTKVQLTGYANNGVVLAELPNFWWLYGIEQLGQANEYASGTTGSYAWRIQRSSYSYQIRFYGTFASAQYTSVLPTGSTVLFLTDRLSNVQYKR